MKKFLNRLLAGTTGVVLATLLACNAITPTIVPPMTEELGYEVPSIKGITLVGLVQGAYTLEQKKMELWGYSVQSTLKATVEARDGLLNLLTVLGLGGTAALPLALKRPPKGYVPEREE